MLRISSIQRVLALLKNYVFDATTGGLTWTIASDTSLSLVFGGGVLDGSRLITPTNTTFHPFDPDRPIAIIHDTTTGDIVDAVLPPPSATAVFYSAIAAHDDRLLVSNLLDEGGNSGEVWVYEIDPGTTVNLPTDIALTGDSVVEQAANGTLLGTLSASDADPGETFTFTLLDSAGGRFAINDNQLVVANGAALDFDASATHSISVQVTDSGGSSLTELFTINVLQLIDAPTDAFLSNNSVPESSVRYIHKRVLFGSTGFARTGLASSGNLIVTGSTISTQGGEFGRVEVFQLRPLPSTSPP